MQEVRITFISKTRHREFSSCRWSTSSNCGENTAHTYIDVLGFAPEFLAKQNFTSFLALVDNLRLSTTPGSRPRTIGLLMLTPGRLIRNVRKSSRISWMSMEQEPRSATFHLKYSHFSLILEFLQGLTPHSWATIQSRPSHPNGRLLGSFGMELVKIHY